MPLRGLTDTVPSIIICYIVVVITCILKKGELWSGRNGIKTGVSAPQSLLLVFHHILGISNPVNELDSCLSLRKSYW